MINYKNTIYPFEQYGGRTSLMEILDIIAKQFDIPVIRYMGISYLNVNDIIKKVFNKSINEINFQCDFSEKKIEQLHEIIKTKCINFFGEATTPILKTSYISNNNPNLLSFAGVGCTAIPNDNHFPLGNCFKKIILETQKEYSSYYRIIHGIKDLNFGCLVMDNLPEQYAWGTVWSTDCSCIFEIISYSSMIVKHIFVKSNTDLSFCIPENVINREQFLYELEKVYSLAKSFPFSDIEFCIGSHGILLTQYRPIPHSLHSRILLRNKQSLSLNCPPPYSDIISINGTIEIFTTIKDLNLINKNIIIIVSYQSQNKNSTLKDLIFSLANMNIKSNFTIIALIDDNEHWSHLHAVIAEDFHINHLGYMRNNDFYKIKNLKNGDSVNVYTDIDGWVQIKKNNND